jgi:large subunit ribosomal protein L22
MSTIKSVRAISKYVKMSLNKIRRILDHIRGHSYEEVLMMLEFLPYRAKSPILKVIKSAAANAHNNLNLDQKKLVIAEIYADEGPRLKRLKFRAKGNSNTIVKKTCHITVKINEKQ